MTLTLQDRARGVMLGLACGDALGAQVEFMRRGSFPHQSEMTGGGPHRLQPGQWTDDTAMAMHLGRHLLVDAHVANAGLLASRWIEWWRKGKGSCTDTCFDIGTQTRTALDSWRTTGWYEAPGTARGNGALMRCAPAALRHHDHMTHAYSAAWQQALLTHPRESADLCGVFAALLAEVLTRGDEPDRTRERLATEYGHVYRRQVAQVDSSGFDKSTFEAALWCVMHASDPRAAIVTAANLGDDADTVGAVTGALAGAVWGAQALRTLSPGWFRVLARQKSILEVADALVVA